MFKLFSDGEKFSAPFSTVLSLERRMNVRDAYYISNIPAEFDFFQSTRFVGIGFFGPIHLPPKFTFISSCNFNRFWLDTTVESMIVRIDKILQYINVFRIIEFMYIVEDTSF